MTTKAYVAKAIRVIGQVYLVLAGLVLLGAHFMVLRNQGFAAWQAMVSPFNVTTYLITLAILSPGLAAILFANKLHR